MYGANRRSNKSIWGEPPFKKIDVWGKPPFKQFDMGQTVVERIRSHRSHNLIWGELPSYKGMHVKPDLIACFESKSM